MDMAVRYLFDSHGTWIAFVDGNFVFDRDGEVIGWTPWDKDEVVTKRGEYLGTIIRDGKPRLYRFRDHTYRGYPGRPDEPSYPGYPGHPGHVEEAVPPMGAEDVDLQSLAC
jgi:hypothetical protein